MDLDRPITAWMYFLKTIGIAATDTRDFFGLDAKTILTSGSLLALGLYLLYKVKGEAEFREELVQYAILTIAPFTVFFAGLFLFSWLRAPFKLYLREFEHSGQVISTANKAKEFAAAELEKANAELKELQERSPASEGKRSTDKSETAVAAELIRLRSELDTKERNRQIRDRLSQIVREGGKIMQACLVAEEREYLQGLGNDWAVDTYKFLQTVDPFSAEQFNQASGPTYSHRAPKLNENVWNFVNLRVQELRAIAEKFQ